MFGKTARELQVRITASAERLALAEGELSTAMAELTVGDRADKPIVGERLRNPRAELVAARALLAELVESSR